jgi:hypothetical protein
MQRAGRHVTFRYLDAMGSLRSSLNPAEGSRLLVADAAGLLGAAPVLNHVKEQCAGVAPEVAKWRRLGSLTKPACGCQRVHAVAVVDAASKAAGTQPTQLLCCLGWCAGSAGVMSVLAWQQVLARLVYVLAWQQVLAWLVYVLAWQQVHKRHAAQSGNFQPVHRTRLPAADSRGSGKRTNMEYIHPVREVSQAFESAPQQQRLALQGTHVSMELLPCAGQVG